MTRILHRLLMLALAACITIGSASAQRRTFYIDTDFPEFTHANGKKTLAEAGITGSTKYPNAYRWWTQILQQPAATFQQFTVASAVLNEAHWAGNGSGFDPGAISTSRNNVERIPGGVYDVNVGITVLQGRFIGSGTSIGDGRSGNPAGNASTELRYDHARWMDPRPIRAVIVSGNWGTSQYLESCYISDVRINGQGPHWLDGSYTQHGIALRMMGETAVLDRAYVEMCNGHGVWVNGSGPGKIKHLTTFDNNLAGLYVSNAADGSVNGNSLGMLQVDHVSGDNNGWVVMNRSGGGMKIGYLKNEDGLSASRGRPKKGQVSIEASGWVHMVVGYVTDAVVGASGPSFVFNSTANKSRVVVLQYEQVAQGGVNEGRSALVADPRSKQAWRTSDPAGSKYMCMGFVWTGHGTASTFTCTEPVVSIPFNGTTRLGIASTYAGYDYAAATPVWNPSGGTVTPPPPPTCSWVLGTPGQWSACVNGEETRTTPYVSSAAGCTPTTAKPADQVEKRTCTVTPPPPTGAGINPADVLVVSNSADSRSAQWAQAYATAWGIPAGNIIAVNAGGTSTAPVITDANLATLRAAVEARGLQFTMLAWEYPSFLDNGQSITSAVTFGKRNPSALTVSPLYQYSGTRPRADKGVAPAFLLVSGNYIRRDAHGTNPTGQAILLLAKDQTGTPRGSARAGQTATGVTVWDNRTYSGIGNGNNACNYVSTLCWRADRKPTTTVIAAYQSNYILGDAGTTAWAKGFYGDHVTSFGGFLPAGTNGLNGQSQTPLTYHLDRGASMSVGSVSEPWQGAGGSLAQQFVNVSLFHPMFIGGKPVGVAAWAAVQCPDRMLFAGDPMCAPFTKP